MNKTVPWMYHRQNLETSIVDGVFEERDVLGLKERGVKLLEKKKCSTCGVMTYNHHPKIEVVNCVVCEYNK